MKNRTNQTAEQLLKALGDAFQNAKMQWIPMMKVIEKIIDVKDDDEIKVELTETDYNVLTLPNGLEVLQLKLNEIGFPLPKGAGIEGDPAILTVSF